MTSRVSPDPAFGWLCTPRDGTTLLRSASAAGYFTGVTGTLNPGEVAMVIEASDVNVNKGLPILLLVLNSRSEAGWVYVPMLKEMR